ncbi:MAG TPA: hypothetical protein DEP84_27385 [Chloroflexi bacterium]|nr:hypothetical protein [Chloroflexota bacterium]
MLALAAYTGLNVVDVEDVAVGHVLALERGRIGERYILGSRNLTFKEILGILERVGKFHFTERRTITKIAKRSLASATIYGTMEP